MLSRIVIVTLLALVSAPGCDRQAPTAPEQSPIHVRAVRPTRHRARVAAVTIRFAHSGVEPGKVSSGYDRLQVGAVFADAGLRDAHLVHDLTSHVMTGPRLPAADTCIRQAGPLDPDTRRNTKPTEHMQLLDVGNVSLRSGDRARPLGISMVPSVFSAIRGVRYDVEIDNAREWLAAGTLWITATGGDGITAFRAPVVVPRPVRFTRVGGQPVRGGQVVLPPQSQGLRLRWGSVDGTASLAVIVGAESGKGLDWVRCSLRDDGAFLVPAEVLKGLPQRSARRPWLISLVRQTTAPIPGFSGRPLRLELVDSVRLR